MTPFFSEPISMKLKDLILLLKGLFRFIIPEILRVAGCFVIIR